MEALDSSGYNPQNMLTGTSGHEGPGANGGKGHQGQLERILSSTVMCGNVVALAERIVTTSASMAEQLVDRIEDYAAKALDVGTSHYHVYHNHAPRSSAYVYKDSATFYVEFPYRDVRGKRPARNQPNECSWNF